MYFLTFAITAEIRIVNLCIVFECSQYGHPKNSQYGHLLRSENLCTFDGLGIGENCDTLDDYVFEKFRKQFGYFSEDHY